MGIEVEEHGATTSDGWSLHLKRTVDPSRLQRSRRPLLIVPGYGMNGFIFGFHPRGTSLERHLAEAGLEVWTASLRAQGRSRALAPGADGPSLRGYAERDLPAIIDAVLARTASSSDRVDALGASLGGSITFAHLALVRPHRIASVVAVGSPLRWEEIPPVLRVPFASRRLAGAVRISGARRAASLVLPIVRHAPALLGMYMNAAHVDLAAAAQLVQTVEDPHPRVNRDLASWMRARDMVLRGVNVTDALRAEQGPLMLVLANRDGIVPESVARSAARAWGGRDVTALRIGDPHDWYAHADLFVGHDSPSLVFDPIARWLIDRR